MKIGLLFSFCLLSIASFSQKHNPYAALKFDKVVMYDFEPSGDKGGSIVEANGQLTKHVSKQVRLDRTAILQLNQRLGNKVSFNWGTAACFDPHLGFVYYQGKKIIGYITICIDCNILSANLKLPAQTRSKEGEDATGMSKSFRHFLNLLLKKYKFSHQVPLGSGFDE